MSRVRKAKDSLEKISLGENLRNHKEPIREAYQDKIALYFIGGRKTVLKTCREGREKRKLKSLS